MVLVSTECLIINEPKILTKISVKCNRRIGERCTIDILFWVKLQFREKLSRLYHFAWERYPIFTFYRFCI